MPTVVDSFFVTCHPIVVVICCSVLYYYLTPFFLFFLCFIIEFQNKVGECQTVKSKLEKESKSSSALKVAWASFLSPSSPILSSIFMPALFSPHIELETDFWLFLLSWMNESCFHITYATVRLSVYAYQMFIIIIIIDYYNMLLLLIIVIDYMLLWLTIIDYYVIIMTYYSYCLLCYDLLWLLCVVMTLL